MRRLLLKIFAGVLLFCLGAALWLYLTFYPHHYAASDFEDMEAIAYAADNLRAAGLRGSVSRDYLPGAIWNLKPEAVRVYPSGVLIRLQGFFTYESGLYIPAPEAAKKIETRLNGQADRTYEPLGYGVYSYKVEG